MSRSALQITKSQVSRWLITQIVVIVLAAVCTLLFKGRFFAQSIFIGGLLSFIPQWVFARFWLSYYKASAAPKLVKMFYIGEVIKLFLTGFLLILVLKYIPIHLATCLIGFIIAQVAFWAAPLLSFKLV